MFLFIVKFFKWVFIWTSLLVLFLLFAPSLPPYDITFDDSPMRERVAFEGGLTKNFKLNKAELITDRVQGSSLGYIKVK